MKTAALCLLLFSACDLQTARNYRTYELTWTCLSAEGCERTEQVELIDRAEIIDGDDFVLFLSTRDDVLREYAQMVPSDALPPECSWLYGLTLFAHELEPSRFCRASSSFQLELSIPNREPTTHSRWSIEGRE